MLLLGVCVAGWLTQEGTGEPITLLEGASLWPSVLLRVLTIILSGYLIRRAWCKLGTNLCDISEEMSLAHPGEAIRSNTKRTWRGKVARAFSYRLGKDRKSRDEEYDFDSAWSEYIYQEGLTPRALRVFVYVLLMFMIRCVLLPIFGMATTPARNALSWWSYFWTTLFDVVLMQCLMFFVFDATCFCWIFVKELRRGHTQWPPETKLLFEGRLGLRDVLVDEWIGLVFVEKRTSCINTLIYYPFLAIALTIVARSPLFANFPPSLPIIIIQGISLTVVFGCAIVLRQAERRREKQLSEN